MPLAWFWISLAALICATVLFLVSGFLLVRILGQVLPMLDETRSQVRDLGDLAAGSIGHAADAMDIVESRVSQAMDQAAASGKAAANQALGVGTALSGLYMATKLVGALRKTWRSNQQSSKQRNVWWKPRKR